MDFRLCFPLPVTLFSVLLGCFGLVFSGCEKNPVTRFRLVDPAMHGIDFQNQLFLSDTFNILDYMYFFNGGGVAAGDINQDGLIDLYFSGNQVSSRLYLNEGNLKFRDITMEAGTGTTGWATGVTMVDVNADGWLDIYVCQSGYADPEKRRNQLFINQGDLTFKEMAGAYGLDDTSYSTQAAFFDFDLDGDLDVYLLNHAHQFRGTNVPSGLRIKGESPTTDKLLENISRDGQHPVFVDISKKSGVQMEGFGLGVAIADFNQDGWPDTYVSNDFLSNDLLYLNQQDGSFINSIDQLLQHQSYNGMGNDVADFNNDALPDIFVADMLPYKNSRRKMMAMNTSQDLFNASLQMGYAPQYTRNTLQLNNGFDHQSRDLLPFSEIGQLAGVHATDWSWSALFGDLDNDGWKDLTITTGYYRDITDLDFITYRRHRAAFASQSAQDSLYLHLMAEIPAVKIPNFVFKNQGNYTFSDSAMHWGMDQASLSNGALLADLDNDGDLELVVNNIDQSVFLYENITRSLVKSHYLSLQLVGPALNRDAIGSKVYLYADQKMQFWEKQLCRGYLSSVNVNVHFGLGETDWVDSLIIVWPDATMTKITPERVDTIFQIVYDSISGKPFDFNSRTKHDSIYFLECTDELQIGFVHQENEYQDFKIDRSISYRFSRSGPAVAVGDLNGDSLDDIFIGGSAGFPASIFYQQPDGRFVEEKFRWHQDYEDVAVLIFDADMDGDQDLYVVSGGSEFKPGVMYQDRFYRNSGPAGLVYDPEALPAMHVSGSMVCAGDFDQDGDLDLLVGGRLMPGSYPVDVDSYFLENDQGIFRDITSQVAPELKGAGMITDGLWCDHNGDQILDFVVVGDWMPITLFTNRGGHFVKEVIPLEGDLHSSGWWRCIVAGDFDQDGDIDFVVGNRGSNSEMKISQKYPASIYYSDFDNNSTKESFISYYQISDEGDLKNYPLSDRDEIVDLVPFWKKDFSDYYSYAHATVDQIVKSPPEVEKKAFMQESVLLRNEGGIFTVLPLPVQAQFSTINDFLVEDFNQDGIPDLLCVGNMFEARVSMGWMDASLGLLMLGIGDGQFTVISPEESNFIAGGNTRHLVRILVDGTPVYLVVRNDDRVTAYRRGLPNF